MLSAQQGFKAGTEHTLTSTPQHSQTDLEHLQAYHSDFQVAISQQMCYFVLFECGPAGPASSGRQAFCTPYIQCPHPNPPYYTHSERDPYKIEVDVCKYGKFLEQPFRHLHCDRTKEAPRVLKRAGQCDSCRRKDARRQQRERSWTRIERKYRISSALQKLPLRGLSCRSKTSNPQDRLLHQQQPAGWY